MSTTSTYPTFKAALYSALVTKFRDNEPTVGVEYAWNPALTDDAVFFGRFNFADDPENVGASTFLEQTVPTIKAGRKQRQEDYPLEITVSSFRGDLDSEGAQECEARAWVLVGLVEDVLADDVQAGTSTVQYGTVDRVEIVGGGPIPFDRGWCSVLTVTVEVKSRLT